MTDDLPKEVDDKDLVPDETEPLEEVEELKTDAIPVEDGTEPDPDDDDLDNT